MACRSGHPGGHDRGSRADAGRRSSHIRRWRTELSRDRLPRAGRPTSLRNGFCRNRPLRAHEPLAKSIRPRAYARSTKLVRDRRTRKARRRLRSPHGNASQSGTLGVGGGAGGNARKPDRTRGPDRASREPVRLALRYIDARRPPKSSRCLAEPICGTWKGPTTLPTCLASMPTTGLTRSGFAANTRYRGAFIPEFGVRSAAVDRCLPGRVPREHRHQPRLRFVARRLYLSFTLKRR